MKIFSILLSTVVALAAAQQEVVVSDGALEMDLLNDTDLTPEETAQRVLQDFDACLGPTCRAKLLKFFYGGNLATAFRTMGFPVNPLKKMCCKHCDRFENRMSKKQCEYYCKADADCLPKDQCAVYGDEYRPMVQKVICGIAKMTCRIYEPLPIITPDMVPECMQQDSLEGCYAEADNDLAACAATVKGYETCETPERFASIFKMYYQVPCNIWTHTD